MKGGTFVTSNVPPYFYPMDAAINQVDSTQCENNSDSCGSRTGACASFHDRLRRPALRSASAHSHSAECFCQRQSHSHFTIP